MSSNSVRIKNFMHKNKIILSQFQFIGYNVYKRVFIMQCLHWVATISQPCCIRRIVVLDSVHGAHLIMLYRFLVSYNPRLACTRDHGRGLMRIFWTDEFWKGLCKLLILYKTLSQRRLTKAWFLGEFLKPLSL